MFAMKRVHLLSVAMLFALLATAALVPSRASAQDGQPLELTPYFNGLISLQLPGGEHHVRLEVTKSLPERIADWMTLLGLAAVATHCGLRVAGRAKR